MGKLILGIVLSVCCIIGYVLHTRHQEQERLELKRQKEVARLENIEKIKKEIARTQDKADQLNSDLSEMQTKLSGEQEKQTKTDNDLTETQKKKEDLLSAVNNLSNQSKKIRETQRNKPRASDTASEIRKEIAQLNLGIEKTEEDIKKLDCHYECMKKESYDDKRKPTDNGIWISKTTWVCKKHNYSFTKNIQFMDYRNESARCVNNIKEMRDKISVLTFEAERNNNIDKENKDSNDKVSDEINLRLAKIQTQQRNVETEEAKLISLKRDTDRNIADCNNKINNINNELKSLKYRQLDLAREKESLESAAPQQ